MNKINPLYTLGFFVLMAVVMIYQNSAMEEKISEQAQANAETELLGKQIAALKSQWKDSGAATRKIDAVLAQRAIAPKITSRTKKGGEYHVQVSELNAKALNTLTAKLLNESVPVKSVKMVRNGDKNVTVDLEFAL